MIREVVVVEGKSDVNAVRRAVGADCLMTRGFTLDRHALADLAAAYERRGLIILTDPDSAGERIRRYLAARFPNAKHAFVPREDATADWNGGLDVGVENAAPAAIRSALQKARACHARGADTFSAADLLAAGLSGASNAAGRRARLGAALGLGFANAKVFLRRLNHYGVSRDEFNAALSALDPERT